MSSAGEWRTIKHPFIHVAIIVAACFVSFVIGQRTAPEDERCEAGLAICDEMFTECYDDITQACAPEGWPGVLHRHTGIGMPWCDGYGVFEMEPGHEPSVEYIRGMTETLLAALHAECFAECP